MSTLFVGSLFGISVSIGSAKLLETTLAGKRLTTVPGAPKLGPDFPWPDDKLNIVVNTVDRRQRIVGFGGAMTESTAHNYNALDSEDQASFMKHYFDSADGAGFSLVRVPIGSSDFALSSYSYDDALPAGVSEDPSMKYFDKSLKRDHENGVIGLVKEAAKIVESGGEHSGEQLLRTFGSMWSPPAWMKVPHPDWPTHGMNGSAAPLGLKNGSAVHAAVAKYLVDWIAGMERAGVQIWGLTAQNEPRARQPHFESCLYTP